MGKRARLASVCAVVAAVASGAATPANAQETVRFGLNDPILLHPEGPEQVLDLHQALGATVHRAAVPWRTVQPERGTWDWSYVDEVIGRTSRRGIATVAMLWGVPPWASTTDYHRECFPQPAAERCQRPPAPGRLHDFQEFLRRLALRYPTLAAIEVFNEPNLGTWNWLPEADPEYYARVLRAAHDAVEQVRPDLPVLSGGLGEPPQPIPAGSMRPGEFLERLYRAGAKGAMDGIGVHPYPAQTSPADPQNSSYHRLMSEVRAIRDRHGDRELPLWITETGYTNTGPYGVTAGDQASWLPAIVEDAFAHRDVAAVVVHTLRDRQADRSHPDTGFGLTYADLSPKPVFQSLAQTVNGVKERRAAQRRAAERAAKRQAAKRRAAKRRAAKRRAAALRARRCRRSARTRARSRACRCRRGRRCSPRAERRRAVRGQAVTRARE